MECPACSAAVEENTAKFEVYPGRKSHGNKPNRILFCSKCEIGFAHPMLNDQELEVLYQGGEYWGEKETLILPKTYPVDFTLAQSRWKLISKSIPPNKHELSILDIGAGRGCLGLTAVKDSRFHVQYTAMEPDVGQQEAIRRTWNVSFHKERLTIWDKLENTSETFDIVALSHVLEHVRDPQEFLKFCGSFLKQDGFLFIDIPNQDHLFKPDVFPHHLFFSKSSLNSLLCRLNFEVLQLDAWGRPRESSPMNMSHFTYLHFLAKVQNKLKPLLPDLLLDFLPQYFDWHFGVSRLHTHGTWLRAIAQKNK
jgi:SAM-dependent methyltransferase